MSSANDVVDAARQISLGKTDHQQKSVVVNCRTIRNLMWTRDDNLRKLRDQGYQFDATGRPKNPNGTSDDESGPSDDEDEKKAYDPNQPYRVADRDKRRRRNVFKRRHGFSRKFIVYRIPKSTNADYVVAPHEVAFFDDTDRVASRSTGMRNNPAVWTAWNGYKYDPLRPPKVAGIVDKPGDMGYHNQQVPDTAVCCISGMRSVQFRNSQGLTAYAGDILAVRAPAPVRVDQNGEVDKKSLGAVLAGTPAHKLLAEIVPLNYNEGGNANNYSNVVDHLMNGNNGHRLFEYLEPVGQYIDQLTEAYLDPSNDTLDKILEDESAVLAQWSKKIGSSPQELEAIARKGLTARGAQNAMTDNSAKGKMLRNAYKRMALTVRSTSRQTQLFHASILGMAACNTANNSMGPCMLNKSG